jgi:2-oxoglutarate/2-oxoacid ferredoxin oxidoreductase subunit alpha
MRTLLVNEGEIAPARLIPVLHYDGTPITARFIVEAISRELSGRRVVELREMVS